MQRAAEALLSEGLEQFRAEQFAQAAGFSWKAHPETAQKFVDALTQDGLLTSANEEQTELLFLHRTFQEFLAACSLAKRSWEDLAPTVDRLSWSPNWREVMILLAGEMGCDALAPDGSATMIVDFLELLADPNSDTFNRHRLALAIQCIAEIPSAIRTVPPETHSPHKTPAHVVARIVSEAHAIQMEYLESGASEALPHFEGCWGALAKVDDSALSVLPALLESLRVAQEPAARAYAADALGLMAAEGARKPVVIPTLLHALRKDKDDHVRAAAANALGDIAAQGTSQVEVIPALLWALCRDKSNNVRSGAVNALRLARFETARFPEVISTLCSVVRREKYSGIHRDVVYALGTIGVIAGRDNEIIAALLAALMGSESLVAYYAAEALGELGRRALSDPKVVPALLNRTRDVLVYSAAVHALKAIGASTRLNAEIPVLLQSFRESGSRDIRASSAMALGAIGAEAARNPEVIPALLNCLKEDDGFVSPAAAKALGDMGADAAHHPAVIPALLDFLGSDDGDDAAEALGALGIEAARHPSVIPALLRRLRSRSAYAVDAAAAAEALGSMASEAARRPEVIHALLLSIGKGKDPTVRSEAAEALGAMGVEAARHPKVIPVLLNRLLHGPDESIEDQEDAEAAENVSKSFCEALGSLNRAGVRIFFKRAPRRRGVVLLVQTVEELSTKKGAQRTNPDPQKLEGKGRQ